MKVALTGLPAGQDVFYRVRLEDLAAPTIRGPAQVGRFRTEPADRRSVSFCWSGDTAGQGWGIDEARGGMTIYSTILRNRPDFFCIPATRSTPTGRSRRRSRCPTAACGATA